MTTLVQIGNQTLSSAEIIQLLVSYQMLPLLHREVIIDSACARVQLTLEEKANALIEYQQKHEITSNALIDASLKHYGMTVEQLEAVALRELRLEKFKQATWGTKIESYFINYKPQLDRVIYSLIRTQDMEVAQELYFRIQAREESFESCASIYSQGSEAQTKGLIGPVPITQAHPAIAQKLSNSQPGQLWPPMQLENWVVIVRLEKLIPAQLDDAMRSTLLNHLFEQWLTEQLQQTPISLLDDDNSLNTKTLIPTLVTR